MSPIVEALKAFQDIRRGNFIVGGQYSLANLEVFTAITRIGKRIGGNSALFYSLSRCV